MVLSENFIGQSTGFQWITVTDSHVFPFEYMSMASLGYTPRSNTSNAQDASFCDLETIASQWSLKGGGYSTFKASGNLTVC